MVDHVTRGFGLGWNKGILCPMSPYMRTPSNHDAHPTLNPQSGGGRRMRHPFLDPIVYARTPDRTLNFRHSPLRRVRSVVTKTLDASACVQYVDGDSDIVIHEAWRAEANEASTVVDMFNQFHRYWVTPLPAGRYLGWVPRDRTWKQYFIKLLNVSLGSGDDFSVDEVGRGRPYLMNETLTVSFKLIAESQAPSSVAIGVGI